ncbi:hypothetical protein K502DRAFT_317750 [Neoconidiobolus thromboides FSU 785]|nr:hypothetical protein K502DRAFT_317750 [Neoconidiobolus thromboides FSU 785]
MEHEESDYLINNLEKEVDGYTIKWKKIQNSRSKVIENLRHINQQNVNLLYSLPVKKLSTTARFENVSLLHDSIFIGGRYKKLERNISQTPWVINGIKKTKYSVSELIDEKLKLFFKADNTNFVASGREDADVRMLGEGRPFSIELINPRIVTINEMQLKQLSDEINSNKLVNVVQLKWITKEELKKLKEGEEKKVKHYQCLCYASDIESELKLNQLIADLPTNFDLLQDTPLRVLHRRSPMIRKKTIYSINYHFIKPNFILIKLQAEAGTYIKELVHGDMGRTLPNIKDLLQQKSMDLLELDVTKIDLQWP